MAKSYVALGDSMSIDDYTDIAGGGAVSTFFRWLQTQGEWELTDLTRDGERMEDVDLNDPAVAAADLITLTIGGNDLIANRYEWIDIGIRPFSTEHQRLLRNLRGRNRSAVILVGDIYHPDASLSPREEELLEAVNRTIAAHAAEIDAETVPIYSTFRGRESELLCLQIEPNAAGAAEIARLFQECWQQRGVARSSN